MIEKIRDFWNNGIGRHLKCASDGRVIQFIDIENMRNLHRFSIIVLIIETVSLTAFVFVNFTTVQALRTFFNVSFCIAVCAIAAIISKKVVAVYEEKGTISHVKTNAIVAIFYLLMSFWGAFVDIAHYLKGEQMLTFYIVQFCFICFVVITPRISCILITLSFAMLYTHLYLIDGAAGVQLLNHLIFGVIAISGNAVQYASQQKTEENRIEVLELNCKLQQEATIDEGTGLFNRNCFNRDRIRLEQGDTDRLCLVFIDVNGLHELNNTKGHDAGDLMLRQIAQLCKKNFAHDLVYRMGGDEFLMIIEDQEKEDVEQAVTCLLQDVEVLGYSIAYGISFSSDRIDVSGMLKDADEKMLKNKNRHYGNACHRSR